MLRLRVRSRTWSSPFVQIMKSFFFFIFTLDSYFHFLWKCSQASFALTCRSPIIWQERTPRGRRSCQTRCSTFRWTHLPESTGAQQEEGYPWPWSLTDRLMFPAESPANIKMMRMIYCLSSVTKENTKMVIYTVYLHDIIVSGQVEHLPTNVEGDDRERWNLLTVN